MATPESQSTDLLDRERVTPVDDTTNSPPTMSITDVIDGVVSDDELLVPGDNQRLLEVGREEPTIKDVQTTGLDSEFWSRRERWLSMLALFAAGAIAFSVRTALPVSAKSIEIDNNWNKTNTGLVLSAFFAGHIVTQVLGGYVSDRYGGEFAMVVSMVGWSTLTLVTPMLVSPWSSTGRLYSLAVIRFITGCVQGFHFPALNSVLARRVPRDQRAFSHGFIMSGTYFGTLITGVVGSVMLEHLGWPSVFYSIGTAGLLWVAFVVFYALYTGSKRPHSPVSKTSDANSPVILAENGDNGSHTDDTVSGTQSSRATLLPDQRKTTFSVPWPTLLRRFSFWAIIVAHFCGRWTFFILFSWLPTYFQEEFPTQQAWVYNSVPWIISIPCQWFAGWLGDTLIRRGFSTTFVRKLAQTLSFAGSGIFVLILAFVHRNYVASLVCTSLAITFCAFHRSGAVVNVQDIAPKYAGSVFGAMNMAGSLPGFVGVYVAGLLQQSMGGWSAVFISTTINCVVGGVFFLVFASGEEIL